MIEALIGSLIAVIATGAMSLMAEVFVQSQGELGQRSLSAYEEEVLAVISSARGDVSLSDDQRGQVKAWLQQHWNGEL